MKSLVLLAGCGLGDGSCIEEVVLTYLALEKHHCTYQPVAQSMSAVSIDHRTEEPGGLRDVLAESARMGRGILQPLDSIDPNQFDCLIIPGGMGLMNHYSESDAVRTLLFSFLEQGKPVATMCAGIDFLRHFLGDDLLKPECSFLSPTSFCHDDQRNIYYTPAFRCPADLCQVQEGIDRMIGTINTRFTLRKLQSGTDSGNRASDLIKAKLRANGGHVTVYTARGLPCEVYASTDGKTFTSDKLPIKPAYEYAVFDAIVDLLIQQGGCARKGNGRNYKLGQSGCKENTVAGTVAIYRGHRPGDSIFDPVFVLSAILEWAGVAHNGHGELILNEAYWRTL